MLKGQYFLWLSSIASLQGYSLLLDKLFRTEFWWTNPFDANRAADGVQLRYRFGHMHDIPDSAISAELDNCPCNILEMIVALAIRCENQIMSNKEIGDRTTLWIHDMIGNLGLLYFDDTRYDEREVDAKLLIFLGRRYSRTGEDGGLFPIPDLDHSRDMRTAEIWFQMNWYLNKILY